MAGAGEITSRAIRVHAFGGPEAMRLESVVVPAPGDGEVRVRHTAIGVNFIDTYHRSGLYPLSLPTGLGSEAAGVVDAVGSGVEGFAPGQRVVYTGRGPADGYSEMRNLPADWLLPIPDHVSDEIAAAALLKGLTAWFLLHRSYVVQSGDWVLIHAASGGVGQIATQWASALGANVIAVVGNNEKAILASQNGARHVLQSAPGELAPRVRELTEGKGVRVVYDSVGKDTMFDSLDCLAPHGFMVSYGNASGPAPAVAPLELAKRGSLYLTRPVLFDFIPTPEARLAASDLLFSKIADGTLRVAVNQRFKLADAAKAHEALESRATIGATILVP